MKTDENFNKNNNSEKNESILDDITKNDNLLHKLFGVINKYNAETSQYVVYCENLNINIKKEFSEIKEMLYEKINNLMLEYSKTNSKLLNEKVILKSQIEFLKEENEEIIKKTEDLKIKIKKMEKIIGHELINGDKLPFKTK